jgi:hypothetical protein
MEHLFVLIVTHLVSLGPFTLDFLSNSGILLSTFIVSSFYKLLLQKIYKEYIRIKNMETIMLKKITHLQIALAAFLLTHPAFASFGQMIGDAATKGKGLFKFVFALIGGALFGRIVQEALDKDLKVTNPVVKILGIALCVGLYFKPELLINMIKGVFS